MPLFVTKTASPVLGGLLAVMVAATLVLPASADEPPPPGGYPSWADVQQAQTSEAAKAAEITTINGLLSGLQSQSEAAGDAAVRAAADSAAADAELQAASSKLEALTARVARANADLARYRKEIGALAVQSYKTGGTTTGFFVAMDALENNSVQGLNLIQLVGDKTAALVDQAAAAGKAATSLAEQEQAARAERERLSGEAKAKLDAARSAQDSLARQVSDEQQHSSELTAQLASLKGTTAALEGEYRQGQAALAAYQAAQEAKRAAAAEQARRQAEAAAQAAAAAARQPKPVPAAPAGNAAEPAPAADPGPVMAPQPSPPPVVVPSIPGGAVNDPAGAKAYASGRLGAFGWGPDQFQCLAQLWTKESGWLTTATNASSGAYGIAQALPPGKYASAGSDWLTSYRTQIEWGLGYIRDRYGSPCGAWSHSVALNWY